MKILCAILLMVALANLVGCLPTLEPVYTDQQLVFDDGLIGVWAEANSNNKWQIDRGDQKSYQVAFLENGKPTGRFVAHVCRLGDLLVMDLFPQEENTASNGLIKFHQIPMHTAYLVSQCQKNWKWRRSISSGWKNTCASIPTNWHRSSRMADWSVQDRRATFRNLSWPTVTSSRIAFR